jgi:hypothetical protein
MGVVEEREIDARRSGSVTSSTDPTILARRHQKHLIGLFATQPLGGMHQHGPI